MKEAPVAPALERFVPALVKRDFDAIERLFHDSVQFRALVPPGLREGHGPVESTAYLRGWFGDVDAAEVVASQIEQVGDRTSISYRLRVHEDGRWYSVAQRAFCECADGKIKTMDLLCSGFMPE